MAPRISDQDVDKAVSEWRSAGIQTALTPEQRDQVVALSQEKDPEVRAAKIVALTEAVIQEAEAGLRRGENLLRDLGIEDGLTTRFRNGDRLTDEGKRKIAAVLEAHQRELLRDAEIEAKRAFDQGRASRMRSPRPGRLSV